MVRCIYAQIAEGNTASVKAAVAQGFHFSGKTEVLKFHGKDYRHLIYELVAPNG